MWSTTGNAGWLGRGAGGRGQRRVQLDEDDDKAQGTCQTLILV